MKPLGERILLVVVCAAVGWFDLWTVRSSGDPWKFGLEQRDYYNLLLDGWLDGQLHLKVEVPEALRQLKDPYDPAVRPPGLGLHDATYFQGKYYLYFGVAPVVVLMLPFRVWAGFDLPLPVAALIFVYGAFLASVALGLAVRRRYFPDTGSAATLLGVLVLGFAGLGPVLLRRPHMWELPIGAGSCFALLALLGVWQSLHAGCGRPGEEGSSAGGLSAASARRRAWWFGGAGLCLGLAIASRPTYLIASPFLAVPLVWWWREERRVPWRPLGAALVPLAVIGGAMAWHNWARFGDPLQFGQAYQLSLDYESKMAHFRASHVPFNVWRYFFSGAEWSPAFPFIQPAALPPKPPGFGGHDDVYGLLANLPVAWLALAAPLAVGWRGAGGRRVLGVWLAAAAVLFAGMAGTLVFFFGSLARYQSDFTPVLMLLAVVGALAVERALRRLPSAAGRVAGRLGLAGVAVFSAGFGALYSLQLDGLLLERNPAKYWEVARCLNRGPAAIAHLAGRRHGPIELELRLEEGMRGGREVLFTVGDGARRDAVSLVAEADGQVSVEVETALGVKCRTRPVAAAGSLHRLRVTMGSLLPDEAHPWFGDADAGEVAALTRRLRIEWDGQILLEQAPWFAGPPGAVTLASGGTRIGAVRRDEAALAEWRAAGREWAREVGRWLTPRGTIRLQVELPHGRVGACEPLVVTGRPGRGDLLAIEYGEAGRVRFCFDHWGAALARSEPVAVDFSRPLEIRVAMESLRPPTVFRRDRLVVTGLLDVAIGGSSVWRERVEFFVVNPAEVAIGRNAIGGTSCGPEFTGVIAAAEPGIR